MIRLLVADDHAIFREGLRRVLAFAREFCYSGEARTGHEVIDRIGHAHYDLLLLDLVMPGPSGVDLIKRVRARAPWLPILVLSVNDEAELVRRVIRAGASGYLTKDAEPTELLEAIRTVAGGGNAVTSRVASKLVFGPPVELGAPHRQLSDREFQILTKLAAGHAITSIAEQLNISPKTVSSHKQRLMRKLGIAGDAQLVRYALDHGLTE